MSFLKFSFSFVFIIASISLSVRSPCSSASEMSSRRVRAVSLAATASLNPDFSQQGVLPSATVRTAWLWTVLE